MTVETSRPFVRIERTVRARPEAVFEAWTEPAALKRWWGPRGVTATDVELDVRPGGRYSITMQREGGTSFVLSGEYREVDRPRRLVKTWGYRGEAVTDPVESLVTVEFVDEGPATRIILTQEFLQEPPDLEGRDRGWRSSLDRLDEYFADEQD